MFRFPDLKPSKIKSASQRCVDCNNWFEYSSKDIKRLEKDWRQSAKCGFVVMEQVKCSLCGELNLIVTPGKYDRPGTPIKKCSVQFVQLA